MTKDIASSIRQRLLNLARLRKEDFDYVLRQYVMQRLLYRLSISEYADQFLLKGALLFWVWNEDFHRPTRDIDLLSFGNNDVLYLIDIFKQILHQEAEDGLIFDYALLSGKEIKEHADYPGVRLTGFATLTKARVPFQIDIGYGDTVFPAPELAIIPAFLDQPAAEMRVYPVYGVIAEKFQAMVMLGIANSRMKDFYDINIIARTMDIDGSLLSQAINATFTRRKTSVTSKPLFVFSKTFTHDRDKQIQWQAFLNKSGLNVKDDFSESLLGIKAFLEPVYQSIADKNEFKLTWSKLMQEWTCKVSR